MKEFKIKLILKEEDEMIAFDDYGNASITYAGYNYMNNIVCASIHMPDTIMIDGAIKENPYILRDEDGSIVEVTANAVSFCQFNGSIVSASATVKMNVEVYFTQSLVELVSIDRTAGNILTKGIFNPEKEPYLIARSINDHLEVVVNIKNDKVIKCISEYTSNKAMGERKIISIAQRNALKKLPPFSAPLKNITGMPGNREGEIELTLYGSDKDQRVRDIISIAKNINANIMTRDLIDINSGEIMDVSNFNSNDEKQNTNSTSSQSNQPVVEQVEYNTQQLIRRQLQKRYTTLPKDIVESTAKSIFQNKKMSDMTNEEIELVLNCAEIAAKGKGINS